MVDKVSTGSAMQIEPVLIPDYLDTTDILLRTGPHQVKISVTAEWAERLSAGIAHALRGDLATEFPQDRVTLGPAEKASAEQILVAVDALDMWPDGHCVLIAHWRAGAHTGQGVFKSMAQARPTDETRVAGLAALIRQLATRIATAIPS